MTQSPPKTNLNTKSIKVFFEDYGIQILELIQLADYFSISYKGRGENATFSAEESAKLEAHLRLALERNQTIPQYLKAAASQTQSQQNSQPQAQPNSQSNPQSAQPNFFSQVASETDSQAQSLGNQQLNAHAQSINASAQQLAVQAIVATNLLASHYIANPQTIQDPELQAQVKQSQDFFSQSLVSPLSRVSSLPALIAQVASQTQSPTLLALPAVQEYRKQQEQQLLLKSADPEEF